MKADFDLGFIRSLMAWIIDTVIGDELFARIMRPKPMHEYHTLVAQRDAFTQDFYKKV